MTPGGVAVRMALVLALGVWCGWASGFPHSTVAAFATWAASLAGVAAVDLLFWQGRRGRSPAITLEPAAHAWPPEGRRHRGPVLVGVAPWSVLAVIVLAWEVLGIDTGPHAPHLTISALAQAYRSLDAAVLFVWVLVGVGFGATRARAPRRPPSVGSAPTASSAVLPAVTGPHPLVLPALLLPHDRAVGVAFWVAVVVVGLLVDLLARRSRGRLATAEELVRLASDPPAVRVLLIGAWTFAGWHLFAH